MIITVPAANVIVPRAVGAVVGAAASNPYTAATVGVVVGALALAKYVDLATPEFRKFPGQVRTVKGAFQRKLHKWSAPRSAPQAVAPSYEAPASERIDPLGTREDVMRFVDAHWPK